ncbi:MAG: hypothetical protein ACYYKD_09015 [Rhodospirillales bacterium]
MHGRRRPQKPAEAVKWYRAAAEQGDANAQYNLGLATKTATASQNCAEALKWLRRAAEQGQAHAQKMLKKLGP